MVVASLAEAWIEIRGVWLIVKAGGVASLAEAWIEIFSVLSSAFVSPSPPSRRRGLKYQTIGDKLRPSYVASLAEAWIEIP